MDVKTQFEALLKDVKNHAVDKQPSNQEKLKLYGWYKQATEGDATGDAPSDLMGKVKHGAWAKLKGMSSNDAMQAYIDFFKA